MDVTVEIHCIGASRIVQRGSFPTRGRTKVQVALAYWKQIKRELSYHVELETVIVDGVQDVTEEVKELQRLEWVKSEDMDLPF